jgi:hypothetical protein
MLASFSGFGDTQKSETFSLVIRNVSELVLRTKNTGFRNGSTTVESVNKKSQTLRHRISLGKTVVAIVRHIREHAGKQT